MHAKEDYVHQILTSGVMAYVLQASPKSLVRLKVQFSCG
jgi:hypothetical protein